MKKSLLFLVNIVYGVPLIAASFLGLGDPGSSHVSENPMIAKVFETRQETLCMVQDSSLSTHHVHSHQPEDGHNCATDHDPAASKSSAQSDESSVATSSTLLDWLSFPEVQVKHQQKPKKAVGIIYGSWCPFGPRMERNVFGHPSIAKYLKDNFYTFRFDIEANDTIRFNDQEYTLLTNVKGHHHKIHEFVLYLTRARLECPTIVFLDENMQNPQPICGFKGVQQLEMLLKFFGENHYKELDWSVFEVLYEQAQKQQLAEEKK